MQNLENRISLLDTAQIDTAEGRLSILAGKMDSIAEKVTSQTDPEKDAKVGGIGTCSFWKYCMLHSIQ